MRARLNRMMALVCAGLVFVGQPLQAASPRGAEHYLEQSLAVVMAAVTILSEKTTLGCDEGGICLVGTPLDIGETYILTRPFQAGRTYVLFAGGDEDASDVDLRISDENDQLVAADNREDRLAMVVFEPPQTGSYTIRMRLHSGDNRRSFCAFVVMRVNGVNVPGGNLGRAGDQFMERCRGLSTLHGLLAGAVTFLDRPEHGALWGVVLEGDEEKTIRNVPFGAKPVTILAAGDTQARDLDLFVYDKNGDQEAQDTAPDATPMLRRPAGVEQNHAITLRNAGDGNPITFALFGVVEDR